MAKDSKKTAAKAPDKAPEKAKSKPATVNITVTDYHTSAPLVLHVNAQKFSFPLGEEVTVPKHVEAAMASVSGVTYETTK